MKIGARSSHLEMSGRHVTQYQLWVLLHVASVIVWVGAGTTLGLATLYAQRAADQALEGLTGFAGWLGPRVLAPSSLAALGFGIVAARSGQWGSPLWVRLGIGAFAVSFLLNVAVRLPLLRRARRGGTAAGGATRLLRSLALVDLTVLYLTVDDMVAKPTGADSGALSAGGAVLAVAVLAATALATIGRHPPAPLASASGRSRR
jgi:hypothetical protein